MRKLMVAITTLFVVVVAVTAVASAGGGGGTVVASGFECGILDGNGDVFTTTDSEIILYQSKAVLHCTGDGAPAPALTFFTFADVPFTCGMLQFGSTTDWVDKVGRSGNSQLTCVQQLDTVTSATSASSAGAGLG